MLSIPQVPLLGGTSIPQLGFGVFQVPPGQTQATVATALEVGYRAIDTAAGYANEAEVGAAVAASGLARDEVHITTKLRNPDQGRDSAVAAFARSLDELAMDHVDLYLIHWPVPAHDLYVETWQAFEGFLADGRARAIGVSNFQPAHLRRLLDETDVVPALNQIELHPYLQQPELRALHAELGIATQAWSPIGRGGPLLEDPVLVALAARHGVTVAQLVLRWHLQLGNVVIPRSVTPSRIRENTELWGFELDEADMAAIAALDRGTRIGPDPDTFISM